MRYRWRLAVPLLFLTLLWFTSSSWLSWLGHYLVLEEQPFKADAIAVLAGDLSGERIGRAVALAKDNWAPLILVSSAGNAFDSSEGDLAVQWAVSNGAPAEWFAVVRHTADSTQEECAVLASECRRRNIHKLLLVTSDYHTHRAGMILRQVAPGVEVRTLGSKSSQFDPDAWWRHRYSRKVWLLEITKTAAHFFRL